MEQRKKHRWDIWRLPIILLQLVLLLILWQRCRPRRHEYETKERKALSRFP